MNYRSSNSDAPEKNIELQLQQGTLYTIVPSTNATISPAVFKLFPGFRSPFTFTAQQRVWAHNLLEMG